MAEAIDPYGRAAGGAMRRRGGGWAAFTIALVAFLIGVLVMAWAARSGRLPGLVPAATVQPVVVKPVIQAPASAVAATVDPATLSVREGVLAGQLAALEARTAAVTADALAAGGQAGRAEGVLVAIAARRAIDRGLPLGYLEPQLRNRFAAVQPRAVDMVIDASARPVTRDYLRLELDNLAPTLATGAQAGWWSSLTRELGSLVVLREAGTPSPLAADRLDRAQRLVDGGQIEAARAEIVRLPGAAGAAGWVDAAGRYVLAHRALDILEATALSGRAAAAR